MSEILQITTETAEATTVEVPRIAQRRASALAREEDRKVSIRGHFQLMSEAAL